MAAFVGLFQAAELAMAKAKGAKEHGLEDVAIGAQRITNTILGFRISNS